MQPKEILTETTEAKTPFCMLQGVLWSIILLLILPRQLSAQEEFVPPPSKHIATIPFTVLTGGIMVVRATLDNSSDSLNFVLDTGSGGISIDSTTCDYLELKREPSNKIVRGIAGMKKVDFTYNHTLRLAGLTVEKLDFHINDYELLTSAYGIKIDGIIGYSFLRRFIVILDYDESLMEVLTPGTYKYPRGGTILKPSFTTIPMQQASIRDNVMVTGRFYFDTGAGLCMLLNDDLVKDSAVLKKKRKIFPTEAEGLGGRKEMNLSVVKEVRIGSYRFRNVPVYIFDDEFNVTSYPVLGGLIGNDILRRFNVILNYPEQQIYIKPNKHYQDSFDYSYTGLSFYLVEGRITVTSVMKDSPAQEAGFKEGDIIVGVENNLSGNIQTYKVLLQNAKSRVKVLIFRNERPLQLSIKVKSVL